MEKIICGNIVGNYNMSSTNFYQNVNRDSADFTGKATKIAFYSGVGGYYKSYLYDDANGLLYANNTPTSNPADSVVYHTIPTPISVVSGAFYKVGVITDVSNGLKAKSAPTNGLRRYGTSGGAYPVFSAPDPYGDVGGDSSSPSCALVGWEPPTISSCDTDPIYDGNNVTITGTDFMTDSNPIKVELCNNSVYGSATVKNVCAVTAQSDVSVTFTADLADLEGTAWIFVTTDIGQINATGYEVDTPIVPVISDIEPTTMSNSEYFAITGTDLMAGGATVEVADGSDYATSNKYTVDIITESDVEIVARMDNEGAFYGSGWIFVTNGYSSVSLGYPVTITSPPSPVVFYGDMVGHGHQPFGRHCFGGMTFDVEPRFIDSTPDDGEIGVSVMFVSVKTSIYCFSGRIQDVHVEINEDGGTFVDAYANGAFIGPYNGIDSYVDFHQSSPQEMTIQVEKTVPWEENIEVIVRVTATDQFGNEATKELPVTW